MKSRLWKATVWVSARPATSIALMQDGKRLDALARATGGLFAELRGDPATLVRGVAYDSRVVGEGDLFFCVPGAVRDGHEFARAAVSAGAAAVCAERPTEAGVPELLVRDVRRAMPLACAEFWGRPGEHLTLLGATGTNGKTTTVFLVDSILVAAARTTGLIGTIETRIGEEVRAGVRTTPESLDLQRLLAEMRARGVDSVAMEVTSHALALHRVDGLRFACAAFTNLSHDHLDFHGEMEDYFEAKRSLFTAERARAGAVNVDDPYGRKLYETREIPCLGFGLSEDADVRALSVRSGRWGNEFVAATPHGQLEISSALGGGFNVYNCLAAATTALHAGVAPEAIEAGIRNLERVPGRFELVDRGQDFAVVVDYAHTPDSLENVLRAARELAREQGGRVLCVFGCGGDRDRGKRPLMGAVAARRADVVIVTSDNPRSEEPAAIIEEIVRGVVAERSDAPDRILVSRREAIVAAVELAEAGDVVVIAGKGHERGQEFADVTVAFDDREVAQEALAERGWSSR